MVSKSELEMIIHGSVSSQLDYFNLLYTGLSKSTLNHLQMVQNVAVRVLSRSSKLSHLKPV